MPGKIRKQTCKPPCSFSDRQKAIEIMGRMEVEKIQKVYVTYDREARRLATEIENEVATHSQWLHDAKESLKRKIYQSGGIHYDIQNHNSKKHKKHHKQYDDAENVDPNKQPVTDQTIKSKLDVSTMRVVELREELQRRKLDNKGLKKDLQKRLKAALAEGSRTIQEEDMKKERQNTSLVHEGETKKDPPLSSSLKKDIIDERMLMEIEDAGITKGSDSKLEIEGTKNPPSNEQKPVANMDDTQTDLRFQNTSKKIDSKQLSSIKPASQKKEKITSADPSSPDSTLKQIESSIEDLTKLRVNSVSSVKRKEKTEDHDQLMEDVTSQTYNHQHQGKIPSPSKSGRVKKLIKATSKLFSPSSKKNDTTPSKPPLQPSPMSLYRSAKKKVKQIKLSDEVSGNTSQSKIDVPVIEVSITDTKDKLESKNWQGLSTVKGHISGNDSSSASAMESEPMNTQSFPYLSSLSTKNSTSNGNSSNTSQRLQQKKEQMNASRKARLEEMRLKSKAITKAKEISLSATKAKAVKVPLQSQLSIQKNKAENGEDGLIKAQIKEKMRQKAAAEALKKATTSSASVKTFPTSKQTSCCVVRPTPQRKETPQPKVLSPMDTYEISDREDSESDYDSEDKSPSPKKRVPKWARSVNLNAALQKQFLDPDRLDPEQLFHEIQTCDLESIFDQNRNGRYSKRTSSGNWTKDKVTVMEKLVYKRQMGFGGAI